MKEILVKNKLKLLGLFIVIYFILIYIINMNLSINDYQIIGAISIALIILTTNFIVVKKYEKEKKIDYKKIILSIIIIGIILRTTYILYTPITQRQHDMEPEVGHLAYIETIYQTGKLPQTNNWQFYQQPLHHIISAGWLHINEFFGIDLATAEEGIQILTAIYSSIIMLITYCILKELNIKDNLKIIIMIIIATHPTFIILSGSINNDILLVMLTFLGLLYLIKWYKNSGIKNTVILAIITALIALTKISGTIIAVPIMYIFIEKFFEDYFKEKDNKVIKKYIFKFAIFAIISMGVGLSYSIRNMFLFGQGIFAVPKAGVALYCGDRNLLDRLNIFSYEWKNIFCNPLEDCNIIAYLIKSSLFGEYSMSNIHGKIIATIMLIINIAIIIISIISLIKILSKKEKKVILNIFIIFYITEIIMYLYSNLSMPYGCTMDFRYIVPTIVLGSIFIVHNMNEKSKIYNRIVKSTIIIFSILSVIFELTYMTEIII